MRFAVILTCLFAAFALAGEPATNNNNIDDFLKSYDSNIHPPQILDRDQWVHVWFGNLSGGPIEAEINERVNLDVFIETSDSAYLAYIGLALGADNRFIDSLLSESEAQLFYPFSEWDNTVFTGPHGSPPNPEGWSSQTFLGLARWTDITEPLLHFNSPYRVMTMAVKTVNDSTLIGQTVEAFASGEDPRQELPNCGDSTGMIEYPITQYFSPLHFMGGGMLEGIVTDIDSNPIGGAFIIDTATLTADSTDTDGEYNIPDIYPGLHSIQVTHASYIDTSITDITIITEQTTNLNIELNLSGFLTGTITNSETSIPLSGVNVTAINNLISDTANTITESDGGYYIDNIHPGYYDLSFELELYHDTTISNINVVAFNPTALNVAMVRIPQNDVGVTAVLNPTDSVASNLAYDCIVEITNYQIDTVSFDVIFEAYLQDSSEAAFADTFNVTDMPAGSIDTITFTDQFEPSTPAVYNIVTYTTLESELNNSNDTTTSSIICYAWGCIDGLVTTRSGEPVPNVLVVVDSTDFLGLTDSTGYYFIDIVPIGPWNLTVSHPDYNDTAITDVMVFLGDTTGVDIELFGWGDIYGVIKDRSDNFIAGVHVDILDAGISDTTGETGQYYFDDIDVGTYSLAFSHPDYNDTTITGITVHHGITTVLNVRLYDWGRLTGTITDQSSNPLQDVEVSVLESSFFAITDDLGYYVIDNIPGGLHDIRFARWHYFPIIVYDVLITHNATTTVDTSLERTVGIDDVSSIPEEYSIKQNYPNPFNAVTSFEYGLPEDAYVTIIIYNLLGYQVATLINQYQPAGYHQVSWDAGANSSGIYFYRIQAGDFSQTKKMLLLK